MLPKINLGKADMQMLQFVDGVSRLVLSNKSGYVVIQLNEVERDHLLLLTSKLQEWQDLVDADADSVASAKADV